MTATTLTPKQRSFVDHYVTCRNGAEAARRAQFGLKSARVTASRLLTRANIQAALAIKEAELQRAVGINKNRVITEVLNGINLAKQTAKAGSIITGWVQIARMLGLEKPEVQKVAMSAEGGVRRTKFDDMSDEELMAIIEGKSQHRCSANLRGNAAVPPPATRWC